MKLTITASNRDRLDLNSPSTQWFIKSIQWQDFKDFELLIADGGSQNYNELKEYFDLTKLEIPMRIVQHKIDLFSRSELNNVGIRNAKGEFVACTDVDMIYAKDFVSTVMSIAKNNTLIESRTMYLKSPTMEKIYNNQLDPYNNINSCKTGRVKKRTSAGGFQCMHIDCWNKINGFDERFKVWGSEDQDLLRRVSMAGINITWIGENDDIRLFHQPHPKKDIKNDLEWQEKNKIFLNSIKSYKANPSGCWGGKQNISV